MPLKFAVCGDSWFSTDLKLPNRSFGETLCKKLGHELIDLARGAATNFCISLQVDKAIEIGADFVIVGTTTSDRIDIPIINDNNQSAWQKLEKGFDWNSWFDLQVACFDKSRGLSNIAYKGYNNGSAQHEWLQNPTTISHSLNSLVFDTFELPEKITAEQKKALKYYMTYLHDTNIRKQVDSWIISDACRRLYQSKIKFLLFIEALYQYDYNKDIQWIEADNVIKPSDLALWSLPRSHYGFHYCPDTGTPVIVETLLPRITTLL